MFLTRKSAPATSSRHRATRPGRSGGHVAAPARQNRSGVRGRAALALAVAAALTGCTTAPEPKPEEMSHAPLAVDEAMQRRGEWPRVAAEFQAGGVDAGVTRFPYQPQTEGPDAGQAIFGNERANVLLDPFFFVAQSIVLPFTYITEPPFTAKNHRGVIYEPTHTAMPLMPPDEEPGAGEPARPAPEETAPVTPDAADASAAPVAPEEAPLEIKPEEMPGEEGTPPAPGGDEPGATPESTDDAAAPAETVPEPEPTLFDPEPGTDEPGAVEPGAAEPTPDAATEPGTEPAPAETTVPEPEPVPLPDAADPPAPEATEPAPADPATDAPAEDPVPAEEPDENK
jgi:hypothetical protein